MVLFLNNFDFVFLAVPAKSNRFALFIVAVVNLFVISNVSVNFFLIIFFILNNFYPRVPCSERDWFEWGPDEKKTTTQKTITDKKNWNN